jgi:hypothetical protein
MAFTESTENVLLGKLNLSPHITILTMDSYIQMFTIAQNGDNNNSPVEEGITRPRVLVPDTEFRGPVTDVSYSDSQVGPRTPVKRWCPKRHRVARTSKLRITEGDDTDPRTLRFEELKVSVEDAELILAVAAGQHPTPSMGRLCLEGLLRTRAILDQMTPQKVKYQRSKKRRR